MDDSRRLTVRYLRELARKHLGRGHTKLKTKAELLAALKPWLPRSFQRKPAPSATAARVSVKPTRRAKVTAFPAPGRGEPTDGRTLSDRTERRSADRGQRKAEPLIEGFFIARVAGEEEARKHHLTEASARLAALKRNGTGALDLAAGEGDDRLHALARDPETLFVFWDWPKTLREEAAGGLKSPGAVLRVFDGDSLVQELQFSPELRSFYVHRLRPGRRYRVEAYLVGADGRSRQIGQSSNVVQLPGPTYSRADARFMEVSWEADLGRLRGDRPANGVRLRTLDPERARDLSAKLRPQALERALDASSERRGWLFSPSGRQ
jgi:hypothetical protein